MNNLPQLIALAGVMGSGKSEVAKYLVREYGYARTRFAGPLKAMLEAFLVASGATPALAARMVDGDLKEAPTPLLDGRSPRHAMQTLGTEWGRELISPRLWTVAWRGAAETIIAAGGRVVVDDCRFENEATIVREMGGWIARTVNAARPAPTNVHQLHASETFPFDVDAEIRHDGVVLPALHKTVDDLLFTIASTRSAA